MVLDFSTVTNITGLLVAQNNAVSGYFWFGLLIMFWIIMLLALLNYGIEQALIASNFTGLTGALLLHYAGNLVNWWGVLFFVGWFVLTIIYVYVTSQRVNS